MPIVHHKTNHNQRPALRNLLAFLGRFGHVFLFVALEIASFALVFRYNSYQGSAWFSTANAVAGRISEASATVSQFFSMAENNRRLTERNLVLEQQMQYLHGLLVDSWQQSALDSALAAVSRPDSTGPKATAGQRMMAQMKTLTDDYRTIPARVVGNELHRTNNFVTINRGRADGVRPDMGVASGLGVVGIVYLTSDHYSVVIPIVSQRSSISCAVGRQGYFGYLRWDGGDIATAWLDDVPRHAKCRRGDAVYTSGYSAVFPRGVLVGHVLQIANSDDGLSFKLKVRLATDFSRLRDVTVIDNTPVRERLQLLQAAHDSLKTR